MAEIVSVISGKGGTGKTSLCAAVASCLAAGGARVLCIDADVGLRNLDISLGMSDEPILPFTAGSIRWKRPPCIRVLRGSAF